MLQAEAFSQPSTPVMSSRILYKLYHTNIEVMTHIFLIGACMSHPLPLKKLLLKMDRVGFSRSLFEQDAV